MNITGPLIADKARKMKDRYGYTDFTGCNGWLARFCTRHNIKCTTLHGEKRSADEDAASLYVTEKKAFFKTYSPSDTYNFDEAAVFFKQVPNRTFLVQGSSKSGSKLEKSRITIFLGCNMDGTDKVKPLVIGHSKNPHCFKRLTVSTTKKKNKLSLPVEYYANKKAWMTKSIFTDFMIKFNSRIKAEKRKVLVILDNFSGHDEHLKLSNIEMVYLPPNCTSILQPLDLGIIKNFKHYYRTALLQEMIEAIDNSTSYNLQVDVLRAIFLVTNAWSEVTKTTIKNCFLKSGLFDGESSQEIDNSVSLQTIWSKISEHYDVQCSLKDYMAIDDTLEQEVIIDEDDMFTGIERDDIESESEIIEEEVQNVTPIETAANILDYLEKTKMFLIRQENVPVALFEKLLDLQKGVHMLRVAKPKKQTKLDEFFV